MTVNLELSREVCGLIHASDKDCYRNALMGMLHIDNAAFYVEGWAHHNILLVNHGWIELDDGTIVDPTPIWCEEGAEPGRYWAGVRYTQTDATRQAVAEGATMPLTEEFQMEMIPRDLVDVYTGAFSEVYGAEAAAFLMQGRNNDATD